MKLIEIDKSNLPKCDVLAYNGIDAPKIGQLEVIDESSVFCIYGQSDEDYIGNITHYLPLTDIKPESERGRTYFAFLSMYSSRNGIETFSSKTTVLKRLNNEPLQPMISEFMLKSRESFAVDRNVDINSVLVTSFSCTETT